MQYPEIPPFKTKVIRLLEGDLFVYTEDAEGNWVDWANLYCVVELRPTSISLSTMRQRMDAVCQFHNWCAGKGIDAGARVESATFFTKAEVEGLRRELRVNLLTRPGPQSRGGRRKPKSGVVTKGQWRARCAAVREYVTWHAEEAIQRMSVRDERLGEARARLADFRSWMSKKIRTHKNVSREGTGRILHRFSVPRAKKGADDYRTDFTRHMLNDEIGARVATLVERNRMRRAAGRWPEGCALPLFPRTAPREDLLGGVRHEYAMHRTSEEILHMLKGAVAKLDIVSHRTGEPLNVNPRRLRRTFATRAVEEGASPAQLASMLDHTDLQNVMVYFETRSSQVERLDTALALRLGPIAKAFMGRIVGDEAEAVNGGDPSKRIAGFRRQPGGPLQRAGNVGTCGSGPCDLFAPISCYGCAKFQPWKDGPHKEMLDWLCEERARKERDGLDKQIVGIHDATILAVAEVVRRCEEATL